MAELSFSGNAVFAVSFSMAVTVTDCRRIKLYDSIVVVLRVVQISGHQTKYIWNMKWFNMLKQRSIGQTCVCTLVTYSDSHKVQL